MAKRKKSIALLMGLIMPGLGQIYNGELVKAVSFYAIFAALPLGMAKLVLFLSDDLLYLGLAGILLIALSLYIFSAAEAYKRAAVSGYDYDLKSYNKWFFYLAAWLVGLTFMVEADSYLKQNVLECYKIVTTSMFPNVLQGDRVIADKTAYSRVTPKVGDIVIHIFPDDRSKVFIRRLAGLPGDSIPLANGTKVIVPHGAAYVLGDDRTKSALHDSRELGSIPLADVVGKVRQVYYSSGPEGIRWDRIGKIFHDERELVDGFN